MNELKPEDVMRALEQCGGLINGLCKNCPLEDDNYCNENLSKYALALLREKDAEIERLNKERDDARRDCAVAEQNHYECKKELETARADSITAFVDGCVKMAIGLGGIPVVCLESIFQFADKMKEETNGKTDL